MREDGAKVTGRRARPRALAWTVVAVSVALFAAAVGMHAAGWGHCAPAWRAASATGARACRLLVENSDLGGMGEIVGFGVMGLLFAVLGSLIAARRHDNVLGWIFAGAGLLFIANGFVNTYTVHGAAEAPGSLPGAAAVAVGAEVLGGPVIFAPFVFFFLLFPNGRLLSRRWRACAWMVGTAVVLQTADLALHAGPLRLAPLMRNPVGVAWLPAEIRSLIQIGGMVLLMLALAAAVVSLILRFRRSRGVERQQMKWFTTSAGFVGATLLLGPLFWEVPTLEPLWGPLFLTATASVPVAATVAILRYRLYDIDVLINRALVYGTLTALLAGVYLGLVVGLQAALSGLGGGSDVAVAASTLVVAALFRPVRGRLQDFINRRFYRRKYDALQTVEAFSAHLRQETDVTALRGELLATVQNTIQPRHALVWLRGDTRA